MATLAPLGIVKSRYLKYIASCRELVMERCTDMDDVYKCESCGRCFVRGPRVLAHHHCFGRGKMVAEPLASHPDFGAGLCRPCHREVHAEPAGQLNRNVCRDALLRAWDTFGIELDPYFKIDGAYIIDLNGYARSLEQILRDDGTWEVLLVKAGR